MTERNEYGIHNYWLSHSEFVAHDKTVKRRLYAQSHCSFVSSMCYAKLCVLVWFGCFFRNFIFLLRVWHCYFFHSVFFISAECSVINVRFRLLRWLIFPFITLHFIVCAKRWNHKWVPHTHIHIHTCMCTCTFHNLKKLYSKHKKYGFFLVYSTSGKYARFLLRKFAEFLHFGNETNKHGILCLMPINGVL